MEEKERYKWSQDIIVECPYEDYDYIVDTENNIIFSDDNYFKLVDLLNRQNKRIKELEAKLALTEKALELAVNDKCYAENCIAESFIGKGAKVRVPKKEQWYLEQAKEMLENE